MGEKTDHFIGIPGNNSCGPNTTLCLGWRCSNQVRDGIQSSSSNGFCPVWYRLDRDSCNSCSGCIFRKSFEEEE